MYHVQFISCLLVADVWGPSHGIINNIFDTTIFQGKSFAYLSLILTLIKYISYTCENAPYDADAAYYKEVLLVFFLSGVCLRQYVVDVVPASNQVHRKFGLKWSRGKFSYNII